MAEVERVIESQRFILGEDVERLEADLAAYTQARFAVGCASGSAALTLALMALGIGPGDHVLTTPFTFFATAGSISEVHAIPVFADIDARSFNLDPDAVRQRLKEDPKIKAVMPVHLFGGSAHMDPILEAAREHGVPVVEDAAQAIGSEYRGKRVGSLGEAGCFSFFPSKNLGAFGDGGLITTNDEPLARKLKSLRVHGRTADYYHDYIGVNSRLDALQAAILRVKLRHLDGWSRRRQENAALYTRLLADHKAPVITPHIMPCQTRHIFNQFVIRCPKRDELRTFLRANGIGCEVYYPIPLHLQPCYGDLGLGTGAFPASEQASREVLALPVFGELSAEQIEYVCDRIRTFYANA